MKNIFIIFLSLLLVSVQAQDKTAPTELVSKSGVPVLPATGDIAIGIDALPYLNYLGNMFNNTAGNTLALGSNNLYFRYQLSENSALRIILNINNTVNYNSFYVPDDAARFANPLSQVQLEDKQTTSISQYGLNLGYIKSRGYGRLRGLYGVQLNYKYNRTSISYAYGNNITVANASPSNAFGFLTERTLETDAVGLGGIQRTIGTGLLAGIEYYFAPKICIGGEVGLGYAFSWGSQANTKTEKLEGSEVVKIDKAISPGNIAHALGTWRPANYGGLYILFHF